MQIVDEKKSDLTVKYKIKKRKTRFFHSCLHSIRFNNAEEKSEFSIWLHHKRLSIFYGFDYNFTIYFHSLLYRELFEVVARRLNKKWIELNWGEKKKRNAIFFCCSKGIFSLPSKSQTCWASIQQLSKRITTN